MRITNGVGIGLALRDELLADFVKEKNSGPNEVGPYNGW